MTSNWQTVPISELCEAIFDGPHATPQKTVSGPIYLGISNLSDGCLDLANTEHLSEEDFIKWTRRVTPKANDLVFSYETRLGEAALIPEGMRCCLGRRMGLMRPNLSKVDPKYLLYAFLGPNFQRTIRERTMPGSTVDRILLTELPNFPIQVPPLNEQYRITRILNSLDNKIELNQRMNQTLEAMVVTFFKSWFVDFDPVVAKAEGRQPFGMNAETAALFPSAFQEKEGQFVPSGWTFRPISEVVADVYDGPHATPKESEIGPVYLGIKNLTGTGIDLSEIRHISEADWPRWIRRVEPQRGDIVFSYEAALGHFALIPPGLRCCLGRRIALIRPSASLENYHFLFHTFIGRPFQALLQSRVNPGSTVDRILLEEFPRYPILYPPEALIHQFEMIVRPIWEHIHLNNNQSRTLADLRNTLLPKLLSGEIRIRQAENLV